MASWHLTPLGAGNPAGFVLRVSPGGSLCPWVNACPSSCLLLSLRNTVLLPAMLLAFFGTLGHQVSCAVWPLVGNPPGQTLCSILGYEWGPGPKHPLTSPGGNHSHPSPPGQRGDTNPCQGGTGWGSGCVYGAGEVAGAAGSPLGTARWQAGSAVPPALGEGLGAGQPLGCAGQGRTGP